MKKYIVALLIVIFSFSSFALANEKRDGLEIGTYLSNKWALGKIADYSSINMGGGISVEYVFPSLPLLGVSGHINNEYVITKTQKTNNWFNSSFSLGVLLNVPVSSSIVFRPELTYGILMNMVTLKGKGNIFTDQQIGVSLSFRFSPSLLREDGISLELAPTYNLAFEKHNLIHNAGIRGGVHYRFK